MKQHPGIVVRHSRPCASRTAGNCNCKPVYEAWVWSPRDEKKIYRSFGSVTEAKNWRRDAGGDVEKGRLRAPPAETVEQAALAWLAKAEAGEILKPGSGERYKPSTLRGYRDAIEDLIVPAIGRIRLARLTQDDVQRLVDKLVGQGRSGTSVRNAVMPLRAVCRRAKLPINPTANLDLPAAAGSRERVASPLEAATLIGALPDADRPLWATAFYAGLRRGELRGLRCSDIDDAVTVIHVQRNWDDKAGAVEPKSRKGNRRVPVPNELRLLLLEHKARTGRRGDDLIFGRTAALPFTSTHVRKQALKAWAAVAVGRFLTGQGGPEIVPIGLHELRHSYVSFMHDAGFSLERIGDYVGHSSAYMTDRYRHLLDGHEQEAANVLDAYLAKRTGGITGGHAAAVQRQPAPLHAIGAAAS